MILAENLETPLKPRSLPLCSPCSFVRGARPDSVGVLNSFAPCRLGPLGISEGLPAVVWEGLSLLVMFPSKSFRSNTYTTVCKCSFQKTCTTAKSFSSNTYKKQGGEAPAQRSGHSIRSESERRVTSRPTLLAICTSLAALCETRRRR